MPLSDMLYPDVCDIHPIVSGGYSPGAEDSSTPSTPSSDVKCSVQDMKSRDGMPGDNRGFETTTQIYFPDDPTTREVLRELRASSIIKIRKRNGVVLSRAINAHVNRTELEDVIGLAIWRADCAIQG